MAPCLPNVVPTRRRVGNAVDSAVLALNALERIVRRGFESG